MSYPGGTLTINYDYDTVGNVTKIRENGATSGVGVLATYAFDTVGHPSSVTFGNGSVQSFAYDAASRLSTLTNNLGGSATTPDLTQTRSEEHTSELQSLMRISYAVFCLKKKTPLFTFIYSSYILYSTSFSY